MVGRLEFVPGGRGKGEVGQRYGVEMVRVTADPTGRPGERRLNRAGRTLRKFGVLRTLLPREFERWEWLAQAGLCPVDPGRFLREQAPELANAWLERRGMAPDRATVSLSGQRADGEMFRAAARLCPRVRRLVVDVEAGGEELARQLRWEFGLPILPAGERADLELRFQRGGRGNSPAAVELFGPRPELGGLHLSCPELEEADRDALDLLAILWERGKMAPSQVKIR